MISFVNAKINIGLNIVNRRPDGYHNLNTVFYPVGKLSGTPLHPVPFADILEIVPGNESFVFSGRNIDVPVEKNLVVRAYRLFNQAMNLKGLSLKKFDIQLDKHLPDGAGLGGGSADAAFTLKALNDLCGNPFSIVELMRLSARLGADCPFFILNEPCYAEGIGDILTPVELDLSAYLLLIVKPDIYVSTAEAFAGIKPAEPSESLTDLIKLPVDQWQGRILNDFEPELIKKHPGIGLVKNLMLSEGALYASMTGSGSALFALFDNSVMRDSAVSRIKNEIPSALIYPL